MDLYAEQIEARDRQYRMADAAAARGDGVKCAEHTRIGRQCDEAAEMILSNTY